MSDARVEVEVCADSGDVAQVAAADMDWSAGPREIWRAPLLVRGGAADWPIAERLTFGRLAEDFGDRLVVASRGNRADEWTTALAAYIDYARYTDEDDPYYLSSVRLSELDPALYAARPLPPALASWLDLLPEEIRPEMCWAFVGPRGSGTPMHIDILGSSAWNAVFDGAKRWVFEVPDGMPWPPGGPARLTCVQEPGDIIYTPPTWRHGVSNVRPCVALTGNYLNAANADAASAWLAAEGRMDWVRMLGHLRNEASGG